MNFDMADNYDWGKNRGCSFVKNSCFDWLERAATGYGMVFFIGIIQNIAVCLIQV